MHERDRQLGREPDHISAQLAGGLVQEACARGLGAVGAASFNTNGSKVGMTDAADLDCPWGKTAVGDVARLAAQPLQQSTEQVDRMVQLQGLGQGMEQPAMGQGVVGQEEAGPKKPTIR